VELLGHMLGFITTQAELQLKAQKERKKAEKVVFDSEERAFWRLRRPGNIFDIFVEEIPLI
jgi:regulator of G-protein signaling